MTRNLRHLGAVWVLFSFCSSLPASADEASVECRRQDVADFSYKVYLQASCTFGTTPGPLPTSSTTTESVQIFGADRNGYTVTRRVNTKVKEGFALKQVDILNISDDGNGILLVAVPGGTPNVGAVRLQCKVRRDQVLSCLEDISW